MIDRVYSMLLQAAVDRVIERWDWQLGPSPLEIRNTLQILAAALEGHCSSPAAPIPGGPALALQLLERLRAEVVDLLPESEPALRLEDLLSLLRAFERVQAHLRSNVPEPLGSMPSGQTYVPELVVELAHDLRSPLTSILFLSETLRQGQSGDVNGLQHRQLGIIYSAALSLVSMAGDVIEYARGGEHLTDKEPSPFSVSATLESIVDLVQPMADERGVELRITAPSSDLRLGYPVPLSRVLLNLTTNALKATESGFVEIMVHERGAARMQFVVRDSGPGIDQDTQKHLFEPFHTNSSSRFGFSGAGLGLSICRRLVNAMGGDLQYETRANWGTRFFFELNLPAVGAVHY